jgi:hypothetical protein
MSGDRDSECPNPLHDWPLSRGYVAASNEADYRLDNGWKNLKCPDCKKYGWRPAPGAVDTREGK